MHLPDPGTLPRARMPDPPAEWENTGPPAPGSAPSGEQPGEEQPPPVPPSDAQPPDEADGEEADTLSGEAPSEDLSGAAQSEPPGGERPSAAQSEPSSGERAGGRRRAGKRLAAKRPGRKRGKHPDGAGSPDGNENSGIAGGPDGGDSPDAAGSTPQPGAEQTGNIPPRKPKRKPSVKRALTRFLVKVALLALAVWVLVTQVGGVFLCHTDDMFPALRDGDLVITFRLGGYHSGDLVVYRQGDQTLFGRVVGEPGDVIVIDEGGNFTVNGLRPYEVIFYNTSIRESDQTTYPYTVQPGEYFILADSREQAADSRTFGPATDLMGKAVLQIRRRGF